MAPGQITTFDKVGAYFNLGKTLFAAIKQLVTAPIRSGPKPKSLYKDVLYAALRTLTSTNTITQEKYLDPTSEQIYLDFAKKRGFQPDSLVLSDGAKAHWLGPRKADKIFIFFHGGGYVLSCSMGHYQWVYGITKDLSKTHSVTSIMLGYTCAPEGQYPTQLRQAVELVKHLIEVDGRKPSDIILGGDSAGGNLTLAVLSHVLHPHPQVASKISINEPFAGAFLMSPWINFRTEDEFITANEKTDLIGIPAASRWSKAFLGNAPKDEYNQPCLAGPDWFQGLESVVKDVLVWAGGAEMLIGGINEIVESLKKSHKRLDYVVEAGAGHVEPIVELDFGYTAKAEGTLLVEEWIAARL